MTDQSHMDHGVRSFDPDLDAGHFRTPAHGMFRVRVTPHGRWYVDVELDTKIGHVCASVHLERESAEAIASSGAALLEDTLAGMCAGADDWAAKLDQAAKERGINERVLRCAHLILRARMGDEQAHRWLRDVHRAARSGRHRGRAAWLGIVDAKAFLQETFGHATSTGNFFSDLGHTISHAVNDVAKAVKKTVSDVVKIEKQVEHAIGPTLNAIKQWGPLVLSSIHGLVSMIPGIGNGVGAVLGMLEAVMAGLNNPLEFLIHLAYGAIPIPPGIRSITDIVLDTILEFIRNPKHLIDVGIAVIRDRIPKGLPQEVFDTLIKIVVKKQPILKAVGEGVIHYAGGLAGQYIGKYTEGLTHTLTAGLKNLSAPLQGLCSKLPDPKVVFQSIHQIAPNFSINPAQIPQLLAHAAQQSGHQPAQDMLDALHHTCAQAVVVHAQEQTALRIAQAAHVAPRVDPPPHLGGVQAVASLAIELSPDGKQQRITGTGSVAHLVANLQGRVTL